MRLPDPVSGFWGKSERKHPERTHPLLAHSADVAAVLEALLGLPSYKKIFEKFMQRNLDAGLIARLCVLGALHDIGKTTAGFQAKNRSGERTNGHIEPLGAIRDSKFQKNFLEIFPFLKEWGGPCSEFLQCVFGHHGAYPQILDEAEDEKKARLCASMWETRLPSGLTPFDGLREISNHIKQWFPIAFKQDAPSLPESPIAQHLFAGLLMMADWIGSDERFFPFAASSDSPESFMPNARMRAAIALQTIGVDVGPIRTSFDLPKSFSDQFHFQPRPIQSATDTIETPRNGSIVIVEAETGSGKTECAVRHFTRLFAEGLVDSMYFANPLRFAATQLQKRVSVYLADAFGPGVFPTVLAVPGYLSVDIVEGIRLSGTEVLWPDEKDPRKNWASEHPKRFLCAPSSVGTIDQALLATLRVQHAHLRAAALSRSLLVIDEVHASDHFMTRLTESLVALFAECGGHILMMSATLGGVVRDRYLNIFKAGKTGCRNAIPSLDQCLAAPYPLVSPLGPAISVQSEVRKNVRIELVRSISAPADIASRAIEAAIRGACVLVLRNSVRSAVETQIELEKLCNGDNSLLFSVHDIPAPHHARYAPDDRRLLDNKVESVFGKAGTERHPCVLVATQTLEQSLDVDFDFLITDLCPADVLLQRIGRLFRHERIRSENFPEPQCCILTPDGGREWLLTKEAKRHQFGDERAYEDQRIIAATWMMLEEIVQGKGIIEIPTMNRSFVEKSTHPDALHSLACSLGPEWESLTQRITGRKYARKSVAALETIKWDEPYSAESVGIADEGKIVTRLGLDDRVVAFSEKPVGPFGLPVEKMVIPGWMVRETGAVEPEAIEHVTKTDDGFDFEAFGKSFRYGRYGLILRT